MECTLCDPGSHSHMVKSFDSNEVSILYKLKKLPENEVSAIPVIFTFQPKKILSEKQNNPTHNHVSFHRKVLDQ